MWFLISDFWYLVSDFSDFRFSISDFRFLISDFGPQFLISDLWLQISDFRFMTSDFWFPISCLPHSPISDFRFWFWFSIFDYENKKKKLLRIFIFPFAFIQKMDWPQSILVLKWFFIKPVKHFRGRLHEKNCTGANFLPEIMTTWFCIELHVSRNKTVSSCPCPLWCQNLV